MDEKQQAFLRQNVVIVGLPAAPKEKVALLTKVTEKRIKDTAKKNGLKLPALNVGIAIDKATQDGESFGLGETDSETTALALERQLGAVALDKKNTLRMMQLERALNLNELSPEQELKEMAKNGQRKLGSPSELTTFSRINAFDWFKDSDQREMYLIRADKDTLVKFLDSVTCEPTLVCDGQQARAEKKKAPLGTDLVWTFGEAFWSPRGSYLVTTHTQGVRLWAGSGFAPVSRLQHRNVEKVLFSNDERYVLTWNGNRATDVPSILLHGVITGEIIKTFPCPSRSPNTDEYWPYFVWSHDSKYIACAGDKGIHVYEMPDATEVLFSDSNKGVLPYFPAENGVHFAWRPNMNVSDPPVLAVWIPSQSDSSPCRLTMLSIPSMVTLTSRNLFSGDGRGRIFWQSRGDYCGLLTHVTKRLQGKRKVIQTQVEIFRMKEKDLPVDSVVAEDDIMDVFWSDAGNRFSVLTINKKIIFYNINHKGVQEVAYIDVPREINCCKWSPLGSQFVLCSLGSPDGTGLLWFGQCSDSDNSSGGAYSVEIVYKDEMNKLINVDWDPSGRFVASSVTIPLGSEIGYKLAGAAGYILWSFQGKALYKEDLDQFHSFEWRPHPPSCLSDKKKSEVKNKLRDYSKKLDAIDAEKRAQRKAELMAERAKIQSVFQAQLNSASMAVQSMPEYADWTEAWKKYDEKYGYEEIIQEIEEELSVVVKPTNVPGKAIS